MATKKTTTRSKSTKAAAKPAAKPAAKTKKAAAARQKPRKWPCAARTAPC